MEKHPAEVSKRRSNFRIRQFLKWSADFNIQRIIRSIYRTRAREHNNTMQKLTLNYMRLQEHTHLNHVHENVYVVCVHVFILKETATTPCHVASLPAPLPRPVPQLPPRHLSHLPLQWQALPLLPLPSLPSCRPTCPLSIMSPRVPETAGPTLSAPASGLWCAPLTTSQSGLAYSCWPSVCWPAPPQVTGSAGGRS